jgi:hypothetical protein
MFGMTREFPPPKAAKKSKVAKPKCWTSSVHPIPPTTSSSTTKTSDDTHNRITHNHQTKENQMSISSTRPVGEGHGYVPPINKASRILAELQEHLPRVDANGKTVVTQAQTGVVETVPTPGQTPSMVNALLAAAAACGADPQALGDSETFMASVGPISPADSSGLQEAVLAAMAVNPSIAIQPEPRPGMRPNPAQGGGGSGSQARPPQSTLERIHDQAAKALTQPLPPGSTSF